MCSNYCYILCVALLHHIPHCGLAWLSLNSDAVVCAMNIFINPLNEPGGL